LIPSSAHSRIVSSAISGLVPIHDRLHAAGDRAQVAVARIAFDLLCVRVDREDLVAPRA
jgi:hypothetical protein